MDTQRTRSEDHHVNPLSFPPHNRGSSSSSSSSNPEVHGGVSTDGPDATLNNFPLLGDRQPAKDSASPSQSPRLDQSHSNRASIEPATPVQNPPVGHQKGKKKVGRPRGSLINQSHFRVNKQTPTIAPKLGYKWSRKTSELVPNHKGQQIRFEDEVEKPNSENPSEDISTHFRRVQFPRHYRKYRPPMVNLGPLQGYEEQMMQIKGPGQQLGKMNSTADNAILQDRSLKISEG